VIAQALRRGHRAGDVVPLPLEEIEALLRTSEPEVAATSTSDGWIGRMLEAARSFDRVRIVDGLQRESTMLGLPRFMLERVEPLVIRVGEAWRAGELDVGHEHFLSEILEDSLRALRTPLEVAAVGPPVILTTLPGESHSLGLQMAGATIVLAGRSVRILGVQTPPAEVAAATISAQAVAVGFSVSPTTATEQTSRAIAEVRERVPAAVRLWIGGGGAGQLPDVPDGARILQRLDALSREVRVLPREERGG
jgi:methanogenic corrinoid protein MtbC1